IPFRTKMIARFSELNRLASFFPSVYNFLVTNRLVAPVLKKMAGFSPRRSLPLLGKTTLSRWFQRHQKKRIWEEKTHAAIYLFVDEFTNYNDVSVGQKTVKLLEALGYDVKILSGMESGRTWLSKGLVREAARIAKQNVGRLQDVVKDEAPLLGIEPSALLTFRDEYIDLVPSHLKDAARTLSSRALLVDEFLAGEADRENINPSQFVGDRKKIKLHGHCHQKALASLTPTVKMLQIPGGYEVEVIPSGCCGMAGSFGYEAEHYDVSMQTGELVLFPAIRAKDADTLIAAPGTSCRHQIWDGTGERACHPVEILYDALIPGGELS
ncbi:MAG: (Fe-S)-binding protein, partial [Marinilabiliaceae bacterium]